MKAWVKVKKNTKSGNLTFPGSKHSQNPEKKVKMGVGGADSFFFPGNINIFTHFHS